MVVKEMMKEQEDVQTKLNQKLDRVTNTITKIHNSSASSMGVNIRNFENSLTKYR
jgi:hypothetical protein